MATVVSSPSPSVSRNTLLRAEYDHRATWKKIVDLVVSLVRELFYGLSLFYHWVFGSHPQRGVRELALQPESRGLFVLIHGLHGKPEIWASQLALLQEERADLFAPDVHATGICSLEEAANPLLPVLVDYARRNPAKPICLLGVSNGSRIATWLETRLRQETPQTAIMVSTIAGVHLGSSRMNLVHDWRVANWVYPAVLREELRYGSSTARRLLDQVMAPLPAGCAPRNYEFYATTEDQSVPDLDSSLPELNKGERYHLIHAHSHDSIVAAVAEQQVRSCLRWMATSEVPIR